MNQIPRNKGTARMKLWPYATLSVLVSALFPHNAPSSQDDEVVTVRGEETISSMRRALQ